MRSFIFRIAAPSPKRVLCLYAKSTAIVHQYLAKSFNRNRGTWKGPACCTKPRSWRMYLLNTFATTRSDASGRPTAFDSNNRRIRRVVLRLGSEEHTSELQSRQYLVCR